ncbi:MAG TPA: hypothetical protein VF637_02850 [Sphingomicrobium sp.]|jgi:hypothetical protein
MPTSELLRSRATFVGTLLVGIVFVIARILLLRDVRDPWIDEAMLTANLPVATVGMLFRPLPLFAQAAPIGYLLPANILAAAFPAQETLALRWLATLASMIAALSMVGALRELGLRRLTPVVIAAAFLSVLGLRYAVETKHYGFEIMAGALLLWGAARLTERRDIASALCFGLAGLVAVATSFTMPIVFAALCAGFAVSEWRRGSLATDRFPLIAGAIAAAIVGVAFMVSYILLVRPTTAYQMASYGELYRMKMLLPPVSVDSIKRWLRLPLIIADMVSPAIFLRWERVMAAVIAVPLISAGVLWLWRRAPALAVTVPVSLAIVCLLSLAGTLPIGEPRHLLVLLPLVSIAAAAGVAMIVDRWAPDSTWIEPAFAILFAVVGTVQAIRSVPHEQVSPLYALYRAEAHGEPLWAFAWSQPAMHEIAPAQPLIAPLPERSSLRAWDADVMRPEAFETNGGQLNADYVAKFGPLAAAHGPMWAIFSHYLSTRNLERMLAASKANGVRCVRRGQQGSALLFRCDRDRSTTK